MKRIAGGLFRVGDSWAAEARCFREISSRNTADSDLNWGEAAIEDSWLHLPQSLQMQGPDLHVFGKSVTEVKLCVQQSG